MRQRQDSPRNYFLQYQQCVAEWVASGYRDHTALDDAAGPLEAWLNDYPAQADQIVQLALGSCYSALGFNLYQVVEAMARIGLDAAFMRPERSTGDTCTLAMLALLSAEADVAQDRAGKGQEMLDYAGEKIASLPEDGLFRVYLDTHRHTLSGILAEAALEVEIAAGHYRAGMAAGLPFLDEPGRLPGLAREWTPLIFGSGPELIEDGAAQSLFILETDVKAACHKAVLGLARTTQTEEVAAARQAVDFVRRFGLPRGGNPVDMRRALLNLPWPEVEGALPGLRELAERFEEEWADSAWKVLLHATRGAHPQAPAEVATAALEETARLLPRCNDLLTLTVAAGDLTGSRLRESTPPAGSEEEEELFDLLRLFLSLLGMANSRLQGSPHYLPFRSLLDPAIARAVAWLFERARQQGPPEDGALLSLLLDALRTPEGDLPLQPEPFSAEQALDLALDRLGRLAAAMMGLEDTAAVILQTAGEDTLFFCAGSEEGDALLLARAGPAYRAAARELAGAFQEEIRQPSPAGESRLPALGQAAFAALPPPVQHLVRAHDLLFWVPDFRSDQDDVPFELFHDGDQYLGLGRIVARVLSLQELLRLVEPPVLPPHRPLRALAVAAPRVPGYKELIYAGWELEEIRALFEEAGLESPKLGEEQLTAEEVLYACEKAGMVHIAAHGAIAAGGEALILPGGERLLAAGIERRPQFLRSAVFLNTCSLGQSRYLGGGVSRGIAYALARRQAPCVLANLLPVYDRSSTELAIAFYDYARSEPAGEALRLARLDMAADGHSPTHWAATVLTGDPRYLLPGTEPAVPVFRPEADVTTRLLNAAIAGDAGQWEAAWAEAVESLRTLAFNPRLTAAFTWVQHLSLDPEEPVEPERIELLAAVARELGHYPGEALLRFHLAENPPAGRSPEERLQDLEAAVRALEPLVDYDELWGNLLNHTLSTAQRLAVPQEPPVIDGLIRVNDQSDPAIRAFYDIQYALDRQQVRHGRQVRLRRAEASLAAVAWNAVVTGRQNRFAADAAHLEFATFLVEKLLVKKLIAAGAREHARRIVAGFLPFLWGSQRIIYLDPDLARGQAETFTLVLESIAANWTPPERSPAHALLSGLPERIDRLVRERAEKGVSRYALALQALTSGSAQQDELSTLGSSLRETIEGLKTRDPQAMADGVAWTLGLLLEKVVALKRGTPAERVAAGQLERIFDDFSGDAEDWFMPYLMPGFAGVRSAPLTLSALWY